MKYGMAVTVTLVFSDEAHREMWLKQQPGFLESAGQQTDYARRREAQNLMYVVPALEEKC